MTWALLGSGAPFLGGGIAGSRRRNRGDLGSVGDFAAGSETAFCTLLQRSYAVLGARMHYGHPDLMNKQPPVCMSAP